MAADRNQGWREAALTGLVERHRTALVRMCCLCLGDASLAEDAAQETFLKAYRALDSFRGECDEKTWLMRIPSTPAGTCGVPAGQGMWTGA